MHFRAPLHVSCLLIVLVAGGCSVPRPKVVPQVAAINRVPCDPELGREMGAFLQDHVSGWKSAGSGPMAAPANYILIEGERGKPFTLGYRNSTIVSKRGGGYLVKQVPQSEVARLKALMGRVPSSRSGAAPMPVAATAQGWEVQGGGVEALRAPAGGAAVAEAKPEVPAAELKPEVPAAGAKPEAASREVEIKPAPARRVETEAEIEKKYQFMKGIWPENSTLVPTSRGFERPGFVYTGVVDEPTLQELKRRYKAEFGDEMLVRKFGT